MKLYIIDIQLIILTQLSLKWLFFCLGIPKKFQGHDILTFSLLHVNNHDVILYIHCTQLTGLIFSSALLAEYLYPFHVYQLTPSANDECKPL